MLQRRAVERREPIDQRVRRRGQLEFPGKLVICSDIPYPPQEFFDDNGNPIGSDIEIGQAIARAAIWFAIVWLPLLMAAVAAAIARASQL